MTSQGTPAMTSEPGLPKLKPGELNEKLREFLESWPLYRRLRVRLEKAAGAIEFPQAIAMPCSSQSCREKPSTTWKLEPEPINAPGRLISGKCAHCDQSTRAFWVLVTSSEPEIVVSTHPTARGRPHHTGQYFEFTIMKVGQVPGWDIKAPKDVARALSPESLDLYQKGLICMSQSYGVGAMAYFRRVVENAIDSLLDLVEEAARSDNDQAAITAIEEARKQHNAEHRLKLAVAVVPTSLRPAGINPLATLYTDYSRGLHALTEEECLEIATELRDALDYVFGNLREKFEQAKAFRERITKRATKS